MAGRKGSQPVLASLQELPEEEEIICSNTRKGKNTRSPISQIVWWEESSYDTNQASANEKTQLVDSFLGMMEDLLKFIILLPRVFVSQKPLIFLPLFMKMSRYTSNNFYTPQLCWHIPVWKTSWRRMRQFSGIPRLDVVHYNFAPVTTSVLSYVLRSNPTFFTFSVPAQGPGAWQVLDKCSWNKWIY